MDGATATVRGTSRRWYEAEHPSTKLGCRTVMTRPILSLLSWSAVLSSLLVPSTLAAQTLTVPTSALEDSTTRPAAIARLATEAVAAYRDSNPLTQLDQRFRLQLLAGRPAGARASIAQLRATQVVRGDSTPADRALDAQYEIYLRAKQLQSDSSAGFPDAFARAFRERFARMD